MPSQNYHFVSITASYGLLVTVSLSSPPPTPARQKIKNRTTTKKPYYLVDFQIESNFINCSIR